MSAAFADEEETLPTISLNAFTTLVLISGSIKSEGKNLLLSYFSALLSAPATEKESRLDYQDELNFFSIMQIGTVASFLINGSSTLFIKYISRLVLKESKSFITV